MITMPDNKQQPFIGARPFAQKESALFFGRDREAHDLRSLIIAHPVVLLYASSGAGKTSLLNAGVIPLLEERELEVLKPARVSGRLPRSLRDKLVNNLYVFNIVSSWANKSMTPAELTTQDIPGFLAASPHITDEVNEPQLRIVILDQFEELFTFSQERWRERQAVFEQLAEALEVDPLLRIVLSMREDFIAQLDPYASILPHGLHTRYHLDPLSADAAREAVIGPLSNAEKSITPDACTALIEQLLSIKVKDGHGDVVETLGKFVEPVQLQVVCQNMWSGVPDNVTEINIEQLQSFADVDEALLQFYEKALKTTCRHTKLNEDTLRHWFNNYMITPVGTRGMAYRGTSHSGRGEYSIPNKAVDDLAARHLIHAEVRAGGERWYELTHDRFISPIQKSNKVWQKKIERRHGQRKILYAGLISFVFIFLLAVGLSIFNISNEREYQRAEGPVSELLTLYEESPKEAVKKSDSVLTNVAGYLWQRDSEDDLNRLVKLLQSVEQVMPEIRPAEQKISYVMPWADPVAVPWPVKVHYHPSRALHSDILLYQWRLTSTGMIKDWGILVPTELDFQIDKTLPVDRIKVTSAHGEKLIDIPTLPHFILVSEEKMPNRLAKWFSQQSSAWQQMETLEYGGPWWLVPLWTRPLFEAAGHPVFPREHALATAVSNIMIDHPEMVVNQYNTSLLFWQILKRKEIAGIHEALRMRGGLSGLVEDLRNIVRNDFSITGLEYLLDALASYPIESYTSEQAAKLAIADQFANSPGVSGKISISDNFEDYTTEINRNTTLENSLPYRDALTYLYDKPRMRIYLSEKLWPLFVTPEFKLLPDVLEDIHELRGEIYKRFGFFGPIIMFNPAAPGELADNQFRVEILNQNSNDSSTRPISILNNEDSLKVILTEVRKRYLEQRSWLIDPEYVNVILLSLPASTQSWIRFNYGVTGIKMLLRGVLSPSDEELLAFSDNNIEKALSFTSGKQSIRDVNWLLGSLLFWQQLREPLDSKSLISDLRKTQGFRLDQFVDLANYEALEDKISIGISALNNDEPSNAVVAFQEAIALDPVHAAEVFLINYQRNRTNLAVRYEDYLTLCGPITQPGQHDKATTISYEVRYKIENLLEQKTEQLDADQQLKLKYCLLEYYASDHAYANQRFVDSLHHFSKPDQIARLLPEQIYAIGYWQLRETGFSELAPKELEQAKTLLIQAFKRWSETNSSMADVAFDELRKRYTWQLPHWYLLLLEQLANAGPQSLSIMTEMGLLLGDGRSPSDIDRGIKWLSQALAYVSGSTSEDKLIKQAWLDLYIAGANYNRSFFSEGEQKTIDSEMSRTQLEKLISTLKEQGQVVNLNWPGDMAYNNLIMLHLSNNDITTAEIVIEDAAEQAWTQEPLFLQNNRFLISLAKGEATSLVLAEYMEDSQFPDTLFKFSFTALLNESDDAEQLARKFFITDHPYRDYIRLILYWHLSKQGKLDQARAYLNERWKSIDRLTWPKRLKQGDTSAWRERLIAYYLGELSQGELMAPLEDKKTFEKSALSALGAYGLSFQGLRAEANFYDALLQQITGDLATRKSRYIDGLRKTMDLSNAAFYEYLMASYLLEIEGGKSNND